MLVRNGIKLFKEVYTSVSQEFVASYLTGDRHSFRCRDACRGTSSVSMVSVGLCYVFKTTAAQAEGRHF